MIDELIPHDRVLILLGRISRSAIERFKVNQLPSIIEEYSGRLNDEWKNFIQEYKNIVEDNNSIYFFVSYAYDRLDVGMKFNRIYKIGEENVVFDCEAEVLAFLNEFILIPMPCIDCGHKSICLVQFREIPKFISEMPESDKFIIEADYEVGLFVSQDM